MLELHMLACTMPCNYVLSVLLFEQSCVFMKMWCGMQVQVAAAELASMLSEWLIEVGPSCLQRKVLLLSSLCSTLGRDEISLYISLLSCALAPVFESCFDVSCFVFA